MTNRGERRFKTVRRKAAAAFLAGAWLAGTLSTMAAGEPTKPTKGAPQTRPATHHAQTHSAQSRPGSTKPSAKAHPKAPPAKPLVFTDEDLKRYHEESTPSPKRAPGPATSEADPLKTLKDQQERERWRQEKIASLQQRILELEGRKKLLEQKRLSIVNPLVGRPDTGEADKSAEQGLSGPELLARTDEEIRQVNQDLE